MLDREFNHEAYQQYLGEHKLMGSRCQNCNAFHLPPRSICPNCYEEHMVWEEANGHGVLVAFTTVHVAPSAMMEAGYGRDNPYCVGVVRLDNGAAISAQITGVDPQHPEQIVIGSQLKSIFIDRGSETDRRTFLAFELA
jgi:uncharacterized OB-fold protein